MKIGNITRTQTAVRSAFQPAAASALERQTSIARYQPTTERFRLHSPGADQAVSQETTATTEHLPPDAAQQDALDEQAMDHLLKYLHAEETAGLARFLASVKVARNASAGKAAQRAQAYANHE